MSEAFSSLDALRFWQMVVVRGLRDLPHDFSQRQLAILLSVYMAPPPHTIGNVAMRLGVPKSSVSRAVNLLSRHDLLKRKKDELDNRNVLLQRTMAGSVFLRDFADIILQELDVNLKT